MSGNLCPGFFHSMTHFEFFKKLKRLKPHEPSVAFLGLLFFFFCLYMFLFLLDYRVGNDTGSHLRGPSLFVTWFGLNNSSSLVKNNSSRNEKVGFLENDSCNIFDGNWVWDENYPLYQSKDCMFLDEGFRCSENGRPDNFYTKWRWQPKDCNLPRFDAKHMLNKLRDQRVVFVGDSIGRNQWESLLCLLSSAVSGNGSIYEVNGSPITKHTGSLIFKFRDYNCTVEYYRAPFLVLQSRPPAGAPENVKMTLKLDQMDWSSAKWKGADILVFNSGHWWNFEKTIRGGCYFQEGIQVNMTMSVETAFQKSLVTLVDWISREVNTSKTKIFFRTYAPVHFRYYSGAILSHLLFRLSHFYRSFQRNFVVVVGTKVMGQLVVYGENGKLLNDI